MADGRLAQTRVGVLGSGGVGRRLAEGFHSRGHDVMIGSRDPAKPELQEWLSGGGAGIEAGTFAQTAAHGELLVLAVLGDAAENAIDDAGAANFTGKVVDVLADFGWSDTIDIGGIEASRELEAICIAWVKIGGARGAWDHGFKLLVG
jgi:predicted dinucleotide-binding enzyme